uniref:HTH three-helical bundle domain-containing protein n=1 Tax=Chenopodium quinoa TaxID=63459 RepID=A0A803MAB8_CHEQI
MSLRFDVISRSNLQEESVKDFERNLCGKSVEVEEATISLEKSSDTTPCRSSLTSDYSVSTHRLQLMASAVARYRSMKLKVARRARTKVIYRGYNDQKSAPKSWAKPQAKTPNKASTSQVITEGTTTTTTESSCLSSGGTSEISSGRNRGKAAAAAVVAEQKRRRGTGPTYISRRAEAILRLLSCKGCASEVRIRQLLGDSPDTSKALRMLLRMEEVKRSGAGGRIDPFIYK